MIDALATIAKQIGAMLLECRKDGVLDGSWQGQQFKAKVDELAHVEWVTRLKRLTPHIPVVSEEDTHSLATVRPRTYWLVDPIDGTASFIHGFPGFVTQAALMEDSRPRLAVVYAPALTGLYWAKHGHGAWLDGKRLRVDPARTPRILIDNYPEPRGIARLAFDSLGLTQYVECGSIALKICKVAEGSVDLFIKDVPVRDWDLAAPQLVLEEAGGVMKDICGNVFPYQGTYEHKGLVAAVSPQSCETVVKWYQQYSLEGGQTNESTCGGRSSG